jgi:uncharacterized protein YprB with RNaseH-like and TPR domain
LTGVLDDFSLDWKKKVPIPVLPIDMTKKSSMQDRKKLRRRLSRLGGKSQRHRQLESTIRKASTESYLGNVHETPLGQTYVIQEEFSHDFVHGIRTLKEYFHFNPALVAAVARNEALCDVELERLLFVDTETTGLVGGAGTLAFLIGVGAFEQDSFVVRQYLLHDPGEEPAMLHLLAEQMEGAQGFVSFNGRVFDVPLMEMRYRMGLRKHYAISSWPHLDLLFPARRLWRRSLPDCSLGTIERQILKVERTDQDVPGEWIPGIYQDYLRSGDLHELQRVVYHNLVDILSLVGLSIEILTRHDHEAGAELTGAEALGVARWHEDDGRAESAEQAFRTAIASKDKQVRIEALRHWTSHLKRNGQANLALDPWEQWHVLAPDDVRPCIELAKYFEWQAHDLEQAAKWSQTALVCLSHWPEDWRRDQTWSEIQHRISRIARKRARSSE